MYIPNGAILLARKVIESKIWQEKPDKWLKIWLYILLKTNHSDKLFRRGTNFFKYEQIQFYANATKHQVDGCLRWLKSVQQLTTQKTTRGMLITVLNYKKYQTLKNYKNDTVNDTVNDNPTENKTKYKRNKNDTINKNEKNDKNDKNKVLSPTGDKIFSFKDKLKSMFSSNDKRIPIIAYYWTVKGISYENEEQYEAGLKRELRPAGLIKGYPNERIKKVCEYLKETADFKWTIETIHKFIDEDIEKLKTKTMSESEELDYIAKK